MRPLFSSICFTLLLLGNLVSFHHFVTLRPLTGQELPNLFNFFAFYFLYLFAQGTVAPVVIIVSVSPPPADFSPVSTAPRPRSDRRGSRCLLVGPPHRPRSCGGFGA